MTSYPGILIDDDTRFRILKCYIYKFIKHRVERRPRFDVKRNCFAKKIFLVQYLASAVGLIS